MRSLISSLSCLAQGFTRAGNIGQAEQLMTEMHRSAVRPNALSYSALIHMYVQAGDLVKAFATLENMRTDKVESNRIPGRARKE